MVKLNSRKFNTFTLILKKFKHRSDIAFFIIEGDIKSYDLLYEIKDFFESGMNNRIKTYVYIFRNNSYNTTIGYLAIWSTMINNNQTKNYVFGLTENNLLFAKRMAFSKEFTVLDKEELIIRLREWIIL